MDMAKTNVRPYLTMRNWNKLGTVGKRKVRKEDAEEEIWRVPFRLDVRV